MRVLEREAELGVLDGAVEQAARRQGSVALVEGPAGIGKTVLLRATRSAAAEHGFRVLVATASPFDRAFPFGLVHQLLGGELAGAEGERRERLLGGAASRAATVLVPGAAEAGDDPEYATLQGLYWLIANLAEEAPLALFVDDLHWADRPSLRVLEYVGRRLEGLAVLVLGTMRPAEADAESELLSAIAGGPVVRVVRPSPLSQAAAGELVTEALGGEPEPAFAAACVAATGGNPLLLRAVARQSAERGLRGAASEAGEVSTLGAGGLRDVVQRRLESLGADAAALARAAAILGERYPLADLGEVAGLAHEATLVAGDRLAAAELLVPGAWSFVHPVMREAVTESIPPAERSRLHGLAARRLRADGARANEVAVHLLHTQPARDETVVTTLREAAATAAAEGAPEAAVAHLRRALAEPPAERAHILLELGELEARTGERDPAVEHLTAALEVGLAGDDVPRARAARGALIVHGDPIRALREFERALEEATDPGLRLRLESLQLESLAFHADLADRRSNVLAAARGSEDPSIVMLAHLAYESGYSGAPADETVGLAVRAMDGSALLRVLGPGNSTFNLLVHAVRYAERPDLSRAWLEEGETAARRTGARSAAVFLEHAWAYWHLNFGSVAVGLAQARPGLDRMRDTGAHVIVGPLAAIAAELLVERDRIEEAADIVDALDPVIFDTIAGPFAMASRGLVRQRQHRLDDAESDLRAAIALLEARGWRAPLVTGARLRLVEVLCAKGQVDEAIALAEANVAVARRAGTEGALGASLRGEGIARGDLDVLREAAERLAATPLRLEHGWALHDLGAWLRRAGKRAAAREPLRQALDVATRTEASLLARSARDELVATGARAVRETLTGPSSLTPSERRVAELAAQGLSNREIAETLWVTRKTVELHLGNAYGKLDIRSRSQLPEALAA